MYFHRTIQSKDEYTCRSTCFEGIKFSLNSINWIKYTCAALLLMNINMKLTCFYTEFYTLPLCSDNVHQTIPSCSDFCWTYLVFSQTKVPYCITAERHSELHIWVEIVNRLGTIFIKNEFVKLLTHWIGTVSSLYSFTFQICIPGEYISHYFLNVT